MADKHSVSSTDGSVSKNKDTESIPKSHESVIKNAWSLYSNKDDEKKLAPSEDEKKAIRQRVHGAGELLIFPDTVQQGILKSVGPGNFPKKTFCYILKAGNRMEYFVKIFEDSNAEPTKISKKLFTSEKLKTQLKNYLVIPAFKPQKMPIDAHTYEVVIYPFIKNCTLQDITLKALKQGYIDPLYHKQNPMGKPHTAGYKMRLLKKFKDCMNIAVAMKSNGYVDMDISPDNFIITTSLNGAAENDKIRWDEITDNKNAKCIKIDHESMIRWAEKFKSVDKPMKNSFKPPEVNSKDNKDEFKDFDVEKANVYQFGATFVYVLYGQLKDIDKNGNEYWKSLPKGGQGDWKNAKWNPKYLDLLWLQKCLDDRPNMRPGYNQLHKYIERELDKFKGSNGKNSKNYIGRNSAPNRPKKNNFNMPQQQQQQRAQQFMRGVNNNGQVTIIHIPQQQGYIMNATQMKQHRMMQQQQQQQMNQRRIIQQQQYNPQQQRIYQQQQRQQNVRCAQRTPGMNMNVQQQQQLNQQRLMQQKRLQQQQLNQQQLNQQRLMQRQRGLQNRGNNNLGNNGRRGQMNRGNNFNNTRQRPRGRN